MIGEQLPNKDHIVRYVSPRNVHMDQIVGLPFQLRLNDSGLSVNWLEFYENLDKPEQLAEIRRVSRLTHRKNGRFAEINVGEVISHVRNELRTLGIVHSPLDAEGNFEADPSHCEIMGLPPGDAEEAELVNDLIKKCVLKLHPAIEE